MEKCNECHERPISIKKRKLCDRCYKREYRRQNGFTRPYNPTVEARGRRSRDREITFINNYFTHNNWVHQPATFEINGTKYRPDFYDAERNVFIEVAGSRQAYHSNREKYYLFRKIYPKLPLEIRQPSGDLLNESEPYGRTQTPTPGG